MVWHYFHCFNGAAKLLDLFQKPFFETHLHRSNQHLAAILGTPNHVVAENVVGSCRRFPTLCGNRTSVLEKHTDANHLLLLYAHTCASCPPESPSPSGVTTPEGIGFLARSP